MRRWVVGHNVLQIDITINWKKRRQKGFWLLLRFQDTVYTSMLPQVNVSDYSDEYKIKRATYNLKK